jgi:hypothetical protein
VDVSHILTLLIGALAGALASHFLAKGREQRQAFHNAAQRLREGLTKSRGAIGYEHFTEAEVDLFRRAAPWTKTRRFKAAFKRYQNAKTESLRRDDTGGEWYAQTPDLKAAYADLLRLTEWP